MHASGKLEHDPGVRDDVNTMNTGPGIRRPIGHLANEHRWHGSFRWRRHQLRRMRLGESICLADIPGEVKRIAPAADGYEDAVSLDEIASVQGKHERARHRDNTATAGKGDSLADRGTDSHTRERSRPCTKRNEIRFNRCKVGATIQIVDHGEQVLVVRPAQETRIRKDLLPGA
jgi:hypothetical protein